MLVYKNTKIGSSSYSDCSTFSFHPVKHIATGEGGMITTNSKVIYDKLLKLRTHGVTKDGDQLTQNPVLVLRNAKHWVLIIRMTDIQAALGCSQIKSLMAL